MLKHMWIAAVLAGLASCGDNESPNTPDGPPGADAPPGDSAVPFTPPTPFAIPISAMGPDQLQSAVATGDGKFYAAGFAAATPTGDKKIIVVKFTATGIDTSFGTQGVVTTDAVFTPSSGGGADEIDIALQSDGKILVSYTVATALLNDRDIAVLRLNTDGTPDLGFGGNGVRVHSLNTAIIPTGGTALTGFDVARSIAVDAQDRIYVHAGQRAEEITVPPRTDLDFAIVRLTADGDIDTAWGDQGEHVLVLPGDGAGVVAFNTGGATPRGIRVLADGSVIASGYQTTVGIGNQAQPVLYKVTATGERDTTWAAGLFHEGVLGVQTEIYHIAIQGDKVVTAGYGRDAGDLNDYVSLRFNLADGARDLGWGGAAKGAVVVDPNGGTPRLASNCRNAVALPDGATALIGSTGQGAPAQDAVFSILDANGRLDARFGDGTHAYPLGANGNDQFWGGAASNEAALFVGYKGGGTTQNEATNDDAYAVILPLP